MGKEKSDKEGMKRLTYVSTSALQSRLPELLLCLLEGETVVIRHRGKTIGYLMPQNEERERELRELNEAAAKQRFGKERTGQPRVEIARDDIIELIHGRDC